MEIDSTDTCIQGYCTMYMSGMRESKEEKKAVSTRSLFEDGEMRINVRGNVKPNKLKT